MSEAQDNGRINRIAELEAENARLSDMIQMEREGQRNLAGTLREICALTRLGDVICRTPDALAEELVLAEADTLFAVNQARRATERYEQLKRDYDLLLLADETDAKAARAEAEKERAAIADLDAALGGVKDDEDVDGFVNGRYSSATVVAEAKKRLERYRAEAEEARRDAKLWGAELLEEQQAHSAAVAEMATLRQRAEAAERDLGEARAEVQRLSCRRCHGKGTVPTSCDDPQCGDSTWDHECGLGGDEPCRAVECVEARALLARLRPAPERRTVVLPSQMSAAALESGAAAEEVPAPGGEKPE